METACFAAGCFWGVERTFSRLDGVVHTETGYTGGSKEDPSYEEVCRENTGHAEAVLVEYDPSVISYGNLLRIFFECHDPTQGMRQGADVGEQYRSAIFYTTEEQAKEAERALLLYQEALRSAGYPEITTQISPLRKFWMAEEYHQKYLQKNPAGYCGLGGTGVAFPS